MKRKINILLMTAGWLACSPVFYSCKEEDPRFQDNDNPVEITSVHLQDSRDKVRDRVVPFARLGQLIRLEGRGFFGVKEVYINGVSTNINPTLMSDNSMIVRVPRTAPTTAAAEDVKNTIVLKKKSLTYRYNFEIRAAAPEITRISHTLPQAGEEITIYGTDLLDITKIIFPGSVEVTDGIVFDEKEGKWCTVTTPAGVANEGGSILVLGANGGAYSPAYFNCKNGVILDFDEHNNHGFWDQATRPEDLFSDVIGEGHVSQGKYCPMIPDKYAPIFAGVPRATEVWTTGNENWRIQFVETNLIPADAPLEEIAFQFDIYVPEEWNNTGFIGVNIANNFSLDNQWKGEFYNYIPWLNGATKKPFKTSGWTTVSVPLNKLYKYATDKQYTFEDILVFREQTLYKNIGLIFHNNDFTLKDITKKDADKGVEFASSNTSVKIYVDNFRLVSLETPEYSDFPK